MKLYRLKYNGISRLVLVVSICYWFLQEPWQKHVGPLGLQGVQSDLLFNALFAWAAESNWVLDDNEIHDDEIAGASVTKEPQEWSSPALSQEKPADQVDNDLSKSLEGQLLAPVSPGASTAAPRNLQAESKKIYIDRNEVDFTVIE